MNVGKPEKPLLPSDSSENNEVSESIEIPLAEINTINTFDPSII